VAELCVLATLPRPKRHKLGQELARVVGYRFVLLHRAVHCMENKLRLAEFHHLVAKGCGRVFSATTRGYLD
jgi:hypothetical protein